MPEPVEQGSPSDDPLLLVGDDKEYTRKTPAIRPASHSGKSTGSRSAARIIDFDAAIAEGSRSGDAREITRDYEVPIHGSEPQYDVGQDWGFGSGGDSDDEDMGNDTFVHVAGAKSKAVSTDLTSRQEEVAPLEASPARSRSNSPLPQAEDEVLPSSPIHSVRAASPAKGASPRLLSSPIIHSGSPARSVAASLPSPFISGSFSSPKLARSGTATPVVHSHRLPSPAPSSPLQEREIIASSPRFAPSQTGTPRGTTVVVEQEQEPAAVPASPAYSEKFSVGMLSAPSSPLSTRSRSRTPTSHLPEPKFEVSTSHAEEFDGEEVQDSWNASPLLLPGTPSALGLFMPEEADGMSTPYSHVGVEPDTPALGLDSLTRSRSAAVPSSSRSTASRVASPSRSPAPEAESLARSIASGAASPLSSTAAQLAASPVMSTHLSRWSPVCLPKEMRLQDEISIAHTSSPRRSPVCLPAEVETQEDMVEDNTPPLDNTLPVVYTHSPRKSTAYSQSPQRSPVCLAQELDHQSEEEVEQDKENQAPIPEQSTTPVLSPPTLKATPPMYALTFSPRIASPLRITARASQSPIPAVESFHARFADEVEECPSADVTLEGNSADWSLSDEGLPEVDDQEIGLGLELHEEEEGEEEDLSASMPGAEDDLETEELEDSLDDSVAEEDLSELAPDNAFEKLGVTVQAESEEALEEQDKLDLDQANESEEQEEELNAPMTSNLEEEVEQPANEGDSTDSEEALSSDEAEYDGERAQEAPVSPEPATIPQKIVLKLISRGIVKIEPSSPINAHANLESPLEEAAEARSTTPAYDPPLPSVTSALAIRSPAPVSSTLYPTLPTTPVTATLSPLVSTTPLESPPARQRSPIRQQSVPSRNETSLQAGPSTRPLSRLSRQISASPEYDGDDSIRVRTPRSLGLEMEDADADNSMRSVVEVSSLDPKAAARAAAILKLVSFVVLWIGLADL
jgi:hypothetical protein